MYTVSCTVWGVGAGLSYLAAVRGERDLASPGKSGRLNTLQDRCTCSYWHQGDRSDPKGCTPSTDLDVRIIIAFGESGQYVIVQTHSALEDVAIHMVVRLVFPTLHAAAIDVRRKSELLVARWSDLDSIAVRERCCEVDYR
jgi:hypothetical protein